jgi:hypothetical protein
MTGADTVPDPRFPNDAAVIRLDGALVTDTHDTLSRVALITLTSKEVVSRSGLAPMASSPLTRL